MQLAARAPQHAGASTHATLESSRRSSLGPGDGVTRMTSDASGHVPSSGYTRTCSVF